MPDLSRHSPVGDDTQRWREAAQLRDAHPGWVVIWLARTQQCRAYQISGRRRSGALTAATAADLAAQISRVPPTG